MVTFKEKTHQYFNEKGQEYISVTTILHKLVPTFDPNGDILRAKAAKLGVAPEVLREQWKQASKDACELGTRFHAALEEHILSTRCDMFVPGVIPNPEFDNLRRSFDKLMESISRSMRDEFHPELLLYDDDSLIAGTADLIIDHYDGTFSVGDFKTNKSISYVAFNNEKLLGAFSHLNNCSYTIYSLQLSLYAYMYAKRTGKTLRQLFIMWIDREHDNEIVFIPVNYLYNEIVTLLTLRKQELEQK